MSVGLFILLPTVIVGFLKDIIKNHILLTLAEGAVRILIFLAYLTLVARMNDIKRIFMYHGAEHKTIHCYEQGLDLAVENVRTQSRLHPRCGTSFLLIVMVVSIIVFSFISWSNPLIRLGLRLALLPVVAGISYEIIKFAGRHDNLFTAVLSAPGKWLQYITTNEPDDSQIEVAIVHYIKDAKVTSADVSKGALEVAMRNAQKNNVDVSFIEHNILQGFPRFEILPDIIVSNPPYIPSRDVLELDKKVKDFEPKSALDGGEDGLDFYRFIIDRVPLNPGGYLAFEVGIGQSRAVENLMRNNFDNIRIVKDLSGIERVVTGMRK